MPPWVAGLAAQCSAPADDGSIAPAYLCSIPADISLVTYYYFIAQPAKATYHSSNAGFSIGTARLIVANLRRKAWSACRHESILRSPSIFEKL